VLDLSRLAETVKDVPDGLMSRYIAIYAEDACDGSEREGELLRSVGFQRHYDNAAEFVRDLVAWPMRTDPKHSQRAVPRLTRAIRIREAVLPAMGNPSLFTFNPDSPFPVWISRDFHIATAVTPLFKSVEIWPIKNSTGLEIHPEADAKVMNLHRDPYGRYELVSFKGGTWEQDLLRYVGAPLGLLTLRACESIPARRSRLGE
jgi:hypothetical protein